MLLFFVMIGITITTAAIFIIAGNSLATTNLEQGEIAREMAEAGAEKALLKILRKDYTNETINNLPGGTVDIRFVNPTDVIATATVGNYVKKIEINITYNGTMDVISWKEIN